MSIATTSPAATHGEAAADARAPQWGGASPPLPLPGSAKVRGNMRYPAVGRPARGLPVPS